MGKSYLLSVFLGVLLFAAAYGDTPSGLPGAQVYTPPNFNRNVGQVMGNLYSSCFNMQSNVKNIGQTMLSGSGACAKVQGCSGLGTLPTAGGAGFGFQMQCLGSEASPAATGLTCDMFTVAGSFDAKTLDGKMCSACGAFQTLSCKKQKMDFVSAELSCLTDKSNILSQQIAALKQEFDKNTNEFQKQFNDIKKDIADRDGQVGFLTNRLGGNKDTGAKGLLELKDKTAAMVNTDIGNNILATSQKVKLVKQLRGVLEEQIQTRKMGLTTECFSTENSGFKCEQSQDIYAKRNRPKSELCQYGSWCDFLMCRYWENLTAKTGGDGYQSEVQRRATNEKVQQLQTTLERVFSLAPQSSKIPKTEEDAAVTADQPIAILTPQDIDSKYGATLDGLSGDSGLNVRKLVMDTTTRCYNRSNSVVEAERGKKNTPIGVKVFELNNQEQAVKNDLKNSLQTYRQHISDVYQGLTGTAVDIPISGCENATPDTQVACLENVRSKMSTLLNGGSGVEGGFNIAIPAANDPAKVIKLACYGLNGCVADMQKTLERLKIEKQNLEQNKIAYAQKAKQTTEDYTNFLAQRFNSQNKMLHDQIRDLNEALRSLGAGQIKIKAKGDGESGRIKLSEDGMPQSPDDMALVIGSRMNPPLVDVSASSFSDALTSVGSSVNKYEEKLSGANEAINKLSSMKLECSNRIASLKSQKITDLASQLLTAKCGINYKWCSANGQEQVEQLIHTVEELGTSGSLAGSTNVTSALRSGSSSCPVAKSQGDEAMLQRSEVYKNKGTDGQIGAVRVYDMLSDSVDLKSSPDTCINITQQVRKELDTIPRGTVPGADAYIRQ